MWIGELKAPAGIEVSFVAGCPGCGTEMFRDDPLGQIERGSREPRNLLAAIENGEFGLVLRADLTDKDAA